MTPFPLQDASLYELVLNREQPPHPLQLSPTTFKSLVGTLIDVVLEQKVPATVWLKLPRGDAWQAEIERYRKHASPASSLYVLKTYRDEGNEKDTVSQALGDLKLDLDPEEARGDRPDPAKFSDLIDDQSVLETTATAYAQNLILPLSPDSQLRREYFLLVVTAEFYGLIVAHRPRSVKQSKADFSNVGDSGMISQIGSVIEDDVERKHPLLSICSFERETLAHILEGIRVAVSLGQAIQRYSDTAITTLLEQWNTIAAPLATASLNPNVLKHLFTYQIQRQEDVWHNSTIFRKQAETASNLQLENEELLNAIRLKDEFLKNIGQELRTPLSTMKTALTLLNSPNIKPIQRQKYMDMLSQECDRQSSLITSVLDLVQLEETASDQAQAQPLRVTDVVPGVVSTYQPLAQEKGIMLAYTIPDELPAVYCLNNWLRQIVINLLHNGIKFTPTGGRVWVRAKRQGDYIEIEFQDTGIGISTSDIPKIFERFYRVRTTSGEESGGAGLGLSIVRQLLLRCGGSISVRSKLGEGSTFTVLLPLYQPG